MSQKLSETSKRLPGTHSFDLVRVNHAKQRLGLSTTTLRKYIKEGLPSYKHCKSCFISQAELELFLRDPRANTKWKRAAKKMVPQARAASLLAAKARAEKRQAA